MQASIETVPSTQVVPFPGSGSSGLRRTEFYYYAVVFDPFLVIAVVLWFKSWI